jgi:hypothetical protein
MLLCGECYETFTLKGVKYNCKAILETPCITTESHVEVFCYIMTVQNTVRVI